MRHMQCLVICFCKLGVDRVNFIQYIEKMKADLFGDLTLLDFECYLKNAL